MIYQHTERMMLFQMSSSRCHSNSPGHMTQQTSHMGSLFWETHSCYTIFLYYILHLPALWLERLKDVDTGVGISAALVKLKNCYYQLYTISFSKP